MNMKRLIEAAERKGKVADVTVGDTKGIPGAPRSKFRYLSGKGVESITIDAAQYLLSRIDPYSPAMGDDRKFQMGFIYGASKLIEINLDDIVEKALKESNDD